MAIWIRFLLSGGRTESGEKLVDSRLFAEIFQPHIPRPFSPLRRPIFPVEYQETAYGLGWSLGTYLGIVLFKLNTHTHRHRLSVQSINIQFCNPVQLFPRHTVPLLQSSAPKVLNPVSNPPSQPVPKLEHNTATCSRNCRAQIRCDYCIAHIRCKSVGNTTAI
jgi:hypothetical protein